jgi:hypothetical protein
VLGLWLLSHQAFDRMPWVVIDFKYDENLARIHKRLLRPLKISERVPGITKRRSRPTPGLYIVHPLPHEQEELDEFMWHIWQYGRCGIFIDEAHMINSRSPALQALLSQGRSKKIPMICISQRPFDISTFTLSQADYIASFELHRRLDQKRVEEHIPVDLRRPIPEFHSYWYDVKRNEMCLLTPCPNPAQIVDEIIERAPRPFWF